MQTDEIWKKRNRNKNKDDREKSETAGREMDNSRRKVQILGFDLKTERNISEKEGDEDRMIRWVTDEERQERKKDLAEYMKIHDCHL